MSLTDNRLWLSQLFVFNVHIMKAWIQRLSKDQLIDELAELGIATEGTIEDLRQRMRLFIRNKQSGIWNGTWHK